ncbi:phage baseplate assembly protein V [Croceibacterium ferulae]|uniref:phage baseplate assembly protein V n=1 Tax=Croceibacterium ferulae TaxID=1854641 RepID=UPI000EADE038|nr:phage baseplate assembly protein V [Croceibacterium ferulae]
MAPYADPAQLTGEVVQIGVIASVDHAAGTCTVIIGDLTTGDLPWLAGRAGGVKIWSPPSVGEQVLVLCPEGDLALGVVLSGLPSDANPAPSASVDLVLIEMPDGATLSYDHAAHALAAALPAGGTATVDAPGGLTINADVTINGRTIMKGDATVDGRLAASTDVTAAGISLKSHLHSGVQTGGAKTRPPE